MPNVEAGDIVIVFSAKTQIYNSSTTSLLSSYRTDIHVYSAEQIPRSRTSKSASAALKESIRPANRNPNTKENEYVLWLWERLEDDIIHTRETAVVSAEHSLNIKEKFCLLKDVKVNKYVDLIVQVVKEPYDLGDKISLWVSDYTEHDSFFNRTEVITNPADDHSYLDGDPYGYTFRKKGESSLRKGQNNWMGPYGKKSMHVTCWEPHANFIRHGVQVGSWIRLRNVHIKDGHDSVNIEGFLHEDRMYPDRVYVDILDPQADNDVMESRLVEALRRKRDYEKQRKQDLKAGNKRAAAEGVAEKENSRTKRQKKRAQEKKEVEEKQKKAEARCDLNKLIISENQDKAIVPLSTILEPVPYRTTINNEPFIFDLPFTNAKYRTQARVVDFHPARLEDFAVSRVSNEYACLSSDGRGDLEDTSDSENGAVPAGRRYIWEWRFALKLEDVSTSTSKTKKPATVWVLVDNLDAQLLTGLDAVDLRSSDHQDVFQNLSYQMCNLWGDLGEWKAKVEAPRIKHAQNPLQAPPVDSDEENGAGSAEGRHALDSSLLKNKPFTCCIRQYGIRVKAEKGEEANADKGWKWQRVFGLFGTKIGSESD